MIKNKTLLTTHPSRSGILFDLLRRSSNETEVIISKITQKIKQIQTRSKSLLDIGANDGLLTHKLYPFFDQIVAVESNKDEIYALNTLGINVYHTRWEDFESEERFDVILASHVIYYLDESNYIIECKRMQNHLKSQGKVFVVSNAHHGEYAEMMGKFYPRLHCGENPFYQTNNLETKLGGVKMSCKNEVLTFDIDFLNLQHFVSLCGFFLDYEPSGLNKIYGDLKEYYINNLKPYGHEKQKKMQVNIDFLTINSNNAGGE